jgi:hypothetical protein
LVRKRRCTATIDFVRAYSSTRNAFFASVAIFTQPAPLAATDVTKHPRHVQNKLGEFLFLSVCRMLPSFAPFKCTDFFVMCRGITNNRLWPVRYLHQYRSPLEFRRYTAFLLIISKSRGCPRHDSGSLSRDSHRGDPGSHPGQSIWDVVDKMALGQIFRRFFFCFSCHHCTRVPYSCITWGMNNWPNGGRSSETYSRLIDMNNRFPWKYYFISNKVTILTHSYSRTLYWLPHIKAT